MSDKLHIFFSNAVSRAPGTGMPGKVIRYVCISKTVFHLEVVCGQLQSAPLKSWRLYLFGIVENWHQLVISYDGKFLPKQIQIVNSAETQLRASLSV